jgi:hypothetical protein
MTKEGLFFVLFFCLQDVDVHDPEDDDLLPHFDAILSAPATPSIGILTRTLKRTHSNAHRTATITEKPHLFKSKKNNNSKLKSNLRTS